MKRQYGKDDLPRSPGENLILARQELERTLVNFVSTFSLHGWMYFTDKDTGDILYFFHHNDFENRPQAEEFLFFLRKNWQEAGFEIVEERTASGDEFYQVHFTSRFFRLKSLK